MKKIILSALAASVAASASAFDPKDLLGNLGKLNGDTTSTTGDSQSTGGVLGSLGSLIGNVVANNKFSIDDLVGTWSYSSPAVSFQSENALMKIGGAGAATAVENQLAPYYQRLGFTNTSLTVDADHNFTLKMGLLVLKGTVEKDEEDNGLVFNFNAFGKISLGKVKANATKAGKTLNLTFDATRLIQMLTKISSKLNIKTLSTLSTILNNYDGIYIGYKLKQ
ncbi:MAG: DUF4923 family protein [Muribaculaceae bacterium]